MGTKKKHFALLLATLLLTLGSFLPTLSVQADEAFSVNSQAKICCGRNKRKNFIRPRRRKNNGDRVNLKNHRVVHRT